MNTHPNLAIVERYVAGFNAGDIEAIAACFTPNAVVHGVLDSSLQSALLVWKDLHRAFGVKLSVEAICSSGEVITVRYKERGVFNGEFRGLAPTGRAYEIVAMHWFEFKNGKIASRWGARDTASIVKQVGMTSTATLNEDKA